MAAISPIVTDLGYVDDVELVENRQTELRGRSDRESNAERPSLTARQVWPAETVTKSDINLAAATDEQLAGFLAADVILALIHRRRRQTPRGVRRRSSTPPLVLAMPVGHRAHNVIFSSSRQPAVPQRLPARGSSTS